MPILNFTMFVDKVKCGEKRQTIRAIRKRPINAGDRLFLYTGLRTKDSKNLLYTLAHHAPNDMRVGIIWESLIPPVVETSYVICKEVHDIWMDGDMNAPYFKPWWIKIDGHFISDEKEIELAIKDGFDNIGDFMRFFQDTHGLPFKGQLIKW